MEIQGKHKKITEIEPSPPKDGEIVYRVNVRALSRSEEAAIKAVASELGITEERVRTARANHVQARNA